MKYIRTKDEIFEYNPLLNVSVYKDAIEADTIEELCEWFVIEETGHYSYRDFNTAKGMLKAIHEGGKLFGAIWTDKGLIYVAKMNAKGELELI